MLIYEAQHLGRKLYFLYQLEIEFGNVSFWARRHYIVKRKLKLEITIFPSGLGILQIII